MRAVAQRRGPALRRQRALALAAVGPDSLSYTKQCPTVLPRFRRRSRRGFGHARALSNNTRRKSRSIDVSFASPSLLPQDSRTTERLTRVIGVFIEDPIRATAPYRSLNLARQIRHARPGTDSGFIASPLYK